MVDIEPLPPAYEQREPYDGLGMVVFLLGFCEFASIIRVISSYKGVVIPLSWIVGLALPCIRRRSTVEMDNREIGQRLEDERGVRKLDELWAKRCGAAIIIAIAIAIVLACSY